MAPATGEVLGWNDTTGAFEWKTIASLASTEPDYLTIGKNVNGSLEVMAYGVTGTQIATNAVTSDKLFTLLAPATGEVLSWNGTAMVWQSASAAASLEPDYITISKNINGSLEVMDLGISSTKIATNAVTADKLATTIAAGTNEVLSWDGAQLKWISVSSAISAESVDNLTIGRNVNSSLEVKDASLLPTKLLATMAPATGEVLGWNDTTGAFEWKTIASLASSEPDYLTIGKNINGSLEVMDSSISAAKIATLLAPATGEVLSWNGTAMMWQSASAAASLEPDYITISKNVNGSLEVMTLGITGTQIATGAVSADKLATLISAGTNEVLSWDGTQLKWISVASAVSAESVDNLTIGRNVNSSLEVKDASLLPTKLLATMAPATGEVLGWNDTTGAFEWKTIASLASTEPDYLTIGKNINGSLEVMDSSISAAKIATLLAPATGEVLSWNGTAMVWQSASAAASLEPDYITISKNINGSLEVMDLGISSTKIATNAVTADKLATTIAAGTNEVLSWDGAQLKWISVSSAMSAEAVDNLTIGRNVNSSLEVKDASLLPTKLLATMAPATGEVLGWNDTTGAFEWKTIASLASTEPDYLTISRNVNGSLEVKDAGINSSKLATGAVTLDAIASANVPIANQFLQWNGISLQWGTAETTGATSEIWTRSAPNVYLTNSTDLIGVGTTTATEKLDIYGNGADVKVKINTGGSYNSALTEYWDNGAQQTKVGYDGANGLTVLHSPVGTAIGIGTDEAGGLGELIYVDTVSGGVGIGGNQTTPKARLHVGALSPSDSALRGEILIANDAPSQTAASVMGLEFLSSTAGDGSGWRIVNPQLGPIKKFPLVFQNRVNDVNWADMVTFDWRGRVGIGLQNQRKCWMLTGGSN